MTEQPASSQLVETLILISTDQACAVFRSLVQLVNQDLIYVSRLTDPHRISLRLLYDRILNVEGPA